MMRGRATLLLHRGHIAVRRPGEGARQFQDLSSTDRDPVGLVKDGPKPSQDIIKREALQLWREVLRVTKMFHWQDTDGRVWRDKLRDSARKEFEQSKEERDPEIITRLLIGGREAVEKVTDIMAAKARELVAEESRQNLQGNAPPPVGGIWDGPATGRRGPRIDPSSAWAGGGQDFGHEIMKQEFSYRHQDWEKRQRMQDAEWRRQWTNDTAGRVLPRDAEQWDKRNRQRMELKEKIELKWKKAAPPS